jgi:hypothetical protein
MLHKQFAIDYNGKDFDNIAKNKSLKIYKKQAWQKLKLKIR